MQEMTHIASSPLWWLSTILIGIIFSFVVPIVKSKLDQKRSGTAAVRSDAWNNEVESIKTKPARQSLQVARVAHHYGRSAFFVLVGLLVSIAASAFPVAIVTILLFLVAAVLTLIGVQEFRYGKASYEQMKDAGES